MNHNALRMHVALASSDLDASVAFYARLFGVDPVKQRPGYAKFEVASPPLNFTLNACPDPIVARLPQHLGIEVSTPKDVASFRKRVEALGATTSTEEDVTCCYAVMDRIWLHDPDGHAWEVFAVTQRDADRHVPAEQVDRPQVDADSTPCCAPTCCT